MNNKTRLTLVLFLLVIGLTGQAQINQKLKQITAEVEAVMIKKNIPAVSIGIVYQGQKYFINKGTLSRDNSTVVSEQSIYQIASLGKAFVGLIIHQLLLDGKLELDQPLTDFLDPVFSEKRWKNLSQITVEQLLHHRSGFPQDARAAYRRKDGTPYDYNYTVENLYTDLKKLRIKKGNNYQYSNFGYALLAHIAEKVANKPFDELLAKNVTQPNGFESTSFAPNTNQQKHVVTPYRKDKRNIKTGFWRMGKLAPPSALYSTTTDLTEMMKIQLKAYQEYEQTQKATAWILTENAIPKNVNTITAYGYGFVFWGFDTYGHAGDMDGFASNYSFNPKADFGVVLLTSSGENWIPPLIGKINKILAQ